MAPCLSKFPSLCFEAIFFHVPLIDLLLSIGLVCSTWYSSRRTELMRRKRLVIVDDEDKLGKLYNLLINSTHETDLIQHVRRDDGSAWATLESLDKVKFDSLVLSDGILKLSTSPILSNFVNITHFVLIIYLFLPNSCLTQVTRLIEHFPHLIDLKLRIENGEIRHGHEEFMHTNVTNLFDCLGRLSSLRHLKLELDLCLRNWPEMSFLSRLITFTIYINGIDGDDADWIFSSLRQYGGNVRSIEWLNKIDLKDILQIDRQLDGKFNVLSVGGLGPDDYDDMKLFCTRFSSLITLKLSVPLNSMPMTMLARCLSPLQQLVHLDLSILLAQSEVEEDEEEGEQEHQPEIAKVPSVRLLNLFFTSKSHRDSEQFFIAEIFPNVQVLRLSHFFLGCSDCEVTSRFSSGLIEYSSPGYAECARLAREPFRRCLNLRTVVLVDSNFHENDTLININEL